MTPVLLDQRSLFKAGMTISLGMLVVFCCGYLVGHQKAASGDSMALNQTIALALPRPAHADTEAFEPQLPQDPGPGADVDVDSPEVSEAGGSVHAESAAETLPTRPGMDDGNQQALNSIEPVASAEEAETANPQLQLASLETTQAVFDGIPAGIGGPGDTDVQEPDSAQTLEAGNESTLAVIQDTAGVEDARYTIQVGAFADEQNALRRLSELEAQDLSAYIDEYTNKRQEIRYNVRFGYFNNHSSALAALELFEQSLAGNGYVARIPSTVSQ